MCSLHQASAEHDDPTTGREAGPSPFPRRLRVVGGRHDRSAEYQLGTDLSQAEEARLLSVQEGPSAHFPRLLRRSSTSCFSFLNIQVSGALPPEGYRLIIAREEIRIVASSYTGAFYGIMTLKQIFRQTKESLPCLEIEDWPDLGRRGLMLDISRNKVPTMQTLTRLVNMLSEWKLNELQLYTEHTFAYAHHADVWKHASPLTAKEVLFLNNYCRDRCIELVPNQNSFGHLRPWLSHTRFRCLAEAPYGCMTKWGYQDGPFSLCPIDPGSIRLLEEWYDELLPLFSSNRFNVGCDETVDLGQGRSQEACRQQGVGRVYLDFLQKIHDLVARRAKTMLFWADIVREHPKLLHELPREAVALEWGYEASHDFSKNAERLAQAGIPFYVCPGTSTWNSIGGRNDVAKENIRRAVEAGLAYSAQGLLLTDWVITVIGSLFLSRILVAHTLLG